MTGVRDLTGAPDPDPELLPSRDVVEPAAVRDAVQRVMSRDAGVVRDRAGLDVAAKTIDDLAPLGEALPARRADSYEVRNLLRVAAAIVVSAQAREESRGAHTRADHTEARDELVGRFVVTGRRPARFVPSRTGSPSA